MSKNKTEEKGLVQLSESAKPHMETSALRADKPIFNYAQPLPKDLPTNNVAATFPNRDTKAPAP